MYTPCIPSFNSCAFGFGSFMAPPPPPMPAFGMPPFGMLTCAPHFSMPVFCPMPIAYAPSMYTALFSALYSHPTNSKFYNPNNYSSNNTNYNYNYSYSNPFSSVPVTNTAYPGMDFYDRLIYSTPNYVYSSTNSYSNSSDYSLFNSRSSNSVSNRYSTNIINANNNANWRSLGYNAAAGSRLASYAMNHRVGFTGYCARYVKNAIAATGLGRYVNGDAYQMVSILRQNRNFREISPTSVNVNNLPAGCILVYGRGVQGYSSQYGHVEITTGDGRAVSDGVTNNLRNRPTAIFMPVAA